MRKLLGRERKSGDVRATSAQFTRQRSPTATDLENPLAAVEIEQFGDPIELALLGLRERLVWRGVDRR